MCRFLPQTFNQLEKLEVLALNANNFEMMPRGLCDMDNLVDLRLGRNGITSLMRGETIQTTLDNGQVITMVVEPFVLMSALRKLTVAMNELSDLPPDIWDVKLDHLNLRNNEIQVRHAAPFPLRLSRVPPKSDAMGWRGGRGSCPSKSSS